MISWDILIAVAITGAGLLAEIFDPSLPVFILIGLALCLYLAARIGLYDMSWLRTFHQDFTAIDPGGGLVDQRVASRLR
jgi:hypothetical protein